MDWNVNGEWRGFYRDTGNWRAVDDPSEDKHAFPIRAIFSQVGLKVSGEMFDGVPEHTATMAEILNDEEHPFAPHEERFANQLLLSHESVEVRSVLPERSILTGSMSGRTLRFTKFYQGEHYVQLELDGRATNVRSMSNHRVLYEGELTEDGKVLEGKWSIPARGIFGRFLKPTNEGTFRLERVLS